MAEAAVNLALGTLNSLLIQEIKLLGSAKQGVEDIKHELERIRSFLKDADARTAEEEEGDGSNEGVKTWVKQVRKEAYRIEDVIDEFSLSMAQLPHASGLVGILYKVSHFIKKLKLQHEIATEIKEIKSSLASIQQRTQRYGLRSIYEEESMSGSRNDIPHNSRVGSLFIEDTEVVGIESTRDKLIGWLTEGRPQRSVIAVVGEGGLGKTTLSRKIFKNKSVKKHFDCQAWITVGKEYIKKDLLRAITQELYNPAGSAPGEIEKIEEKDMIITLREHLKDKCYMVVFDDVWKVEFWEDIENALLENNKSSRIILTTQNRDVVDFVPSSIVQVHMLEPLPLDKARELFCRKAFGSHESCPQNLMELSEEIIVKCGGLPLAIVAVGGLLSTKNKMISEWKSLLDGLDSTLGSDPHLKRCNRVLSEGYCDLPHHLKICLLYFGLFPESYSITRGRLIRLWIAEGLVQYSKRPPSEQVAEEYLAELIKRGLVEVSERKVSGQVRSCKVHDLMYEIILRKNKKMRFCRAVKEEDLNHIRDARRISANRSTYCFLENVKDSKVRSIFIFDIDKLPDAFMTSVVANFKLLKVLDFEDAPLDYLPNVVGDLFHLHYISLRNTKVKILPKSIGKLLNLETLDLRNTYVSKLPIEVRNLKKLRFVRVYFWENNISTAAIINEGFGSLADLRKLDFVEANNSEALKEFRMLRQLRRLGIRLTSNGDVKDLFASIENLKYLEYLAVELTSEEEIEDLESVASPPPLQYFYLKGNIKKLPYWISKLQNLVRIWLVLQGSVDDHLRILQALPNVVEVCLTGRHNDEQLHFKEGWFPNLRELILGELMELKSMMVENGAMPNLKELMIGPCPLLKDVPIGIEHLRNLKTLIFFNMLNDIHCMIKSETWEKVTKHIPDIGVTCNKEKYKDFFYYTTKYLTSLSPEDIEQLISKNSRTQLATNLISETTDDMPSK